MNKTVLPGLLLLLSVNATAHEYYKCLTSNGRIIYTDRQCFAIGGIDIGPKKKASTEKSANEQAAAERQELLANELSKLGKTGADKSKPANPEEPKKSVWQGVVNKISSLFSFANWGADTKPKANAVASTEKPTSVYTCQGKTRCPEMTSCEEAKFYQKNCPNVKLNGDKNGIPCKKQWCK